jgi:tRNA A37 threonylcarbamoyladenosine dehydratase
MASTSANKHSSHTATAVLSGFLLGSSLTILLYNYAYQRSKKHEKNETPATLVTSLPDSVRAEQLSRHELYFGASHFERVKKARVAVIGVGGVGSHAAVMLARAGIGRLRLVDFDQVTLSSLNRHACATLQDVGMPKATCLLEFIRKICPDPNMLHADACVEMYTTESGARLLEDKERWDMVIDAIDDVPTKAALLAHCLRLHIPVLSCMGAGGKADPTRVHISDLRTASKDPLASKLRQSLKKIMPNCNSDDNYLEDMNQLSVVYSSEKTVVKLADFTPEQKEAGFHNFGAVDNMRIRVIPVLGTMPAIMGQSLAALCLTRLGNKEFQPVTGERVGRSVRHKCFQHLKRREDTIRTKVLESAAANTTSTSTDTNDLDENGTVLGGTWIGPLQVDMDDVEYLYEVWRNRCAVTGARLGTVLELVRWDESKPSTCDNLVLMNVNAIKSFDQEGGKNMIPAHVRKRIEDRLATCRVDWNMY